MSESGTAIHAAGQLNHYAQKDFKMNLSWLNNVKKFKFWRCPDHPNGRVKWKGDIATCLTCSGHNKAIDSDPEHDADLEAKEILLMEDPICGKHHF